jgi:hypothetical protein
MANEDIREGNPDKARKKKAPPPDDEDDRPRKKKKVARADEEEDNDLGSSALSAIIPVGGSVFGLLSLWLSVIALLMGIAAIGLMMDKSILAVVLPALWPVSLLCGVLAFLTHKHKASYGSIAGNLRAIIGILISLGVMALHGVLIFLFVMGR